MRAHVLTSLTVLMLLLTACDQKASPPTKSTRHTIGNGITMLEYRIGSIWGFGYTVRVLPIEYLVLEHENCPEAKKRIGSAPERDAQGICVIRINQQQSDRFEAAMDQFKNFSVPLSSYSLEDPYRRPDGQPCRNEVTDQQVISLIWTSTNGTRIATFYAGCDPKELAGFYESLRHVTDSLPIQGILAKQRT